LGALDHNERKRVRDFFSRVCSVEGGFQGHQRVPFADALSTFTGLLSCEQLGLGDVLDRDRLAAFVGSSLEMPSGGFRAAAWDDAADVEYTFYGLGILGLLHSDHSQSV